MNEWEARYKALAAGIEDDNLIANAEKLVRQAENYSVSSTMPFHVAFYSMLQAVHVLRNNVVLKTSALAPRLTNTEPSPVEQRILREEAEMLNETGIYNPD
jgi:hypothetical protein